MTRFRFSLLIGWVLWCVVPSARAQGLFAGQGDEFTYTFDEYGHGFVFGQSAPGVLFPDWTQPGSPQALIFSIPGGGGLGNGDVRVWADTNRSSLSGVLRFTDDQGHLTGQTAHFMIFYSLAG